MTPDSANARDEAQRRWPAKGNPTSTISTAQEQAIRDYLTAHPVLAAALQRRLERSFRTPAHYEEDVMSEHTEPSADRVGWYEFVTVGEAATTHIGYVYEDGSVYLPEGPEVVTESDFRLASATERFWRLVRVS